MITAKNLNEARKQIQKLKKENKKVVVKAQSPEFNRKILENKDVDMIIDLELHDRKDHLKERNSGLNEILCKIAKKNNIKIGIDINNLNKKQDKEKAILLARIMQNIMLCKKTGAEIKIINCKEKDKREVFSLLLTLGASTSQAKKAIEA